ncbi:Ig-like domain-containing protein [Longispora sp. NPDC051575]|uniref:L,D-transpeptidase n=1 Tax=Longispora sp. NPDC051575 TaxID=3154943 RepID=UPI00342394C0
MSDRSRRGVLGAIAGVAALPLLAACGSDEKKTGKPEGVKAESGGTPTPTSEAAITITPANGARDANPASVTVKVERGTLDEVVLTNEAGKVVKGELSADKTTWTLGEPLGYQKSYTVKATAVSTSGKKAEATSSFTTIKPNNQTLPYFTPGAPGTFGVGQPIVVRFDERIPDRKKAQAALTVTTSPETVGAWRWFDDQELHWRPQEYWKPGTKVTVTAKVHGVDLGNGLYGQDDKSVAFDIGPSKIAVADSVSKKMQVFFDGAMVKEFPVSLGKGGTVQVGNNTIDYWTRTGPHVVTTKDREVRMTSASYGGPTTGPDAYDSKIGFAVRISSAGEYVHLRDWDLGRLGKVNDSHGCINVGPGNAQWFFENFNAGDIVDVKNGPRVLDPRDGLGDWVIPWAQWAN